MLVVRTVRFSSWTNSRNARPQFEHDRSARLVIRRHTMRGNEVFPACDSVHHLARKQHESCAALLVRIDPTAAARVPHLQTWFWLQAESENSCVRVRCTKNKLSAQACKPLRVSRRTRAHQIRRVCNVEVMAHRDDRRCHVVIISFGRVQHIQYVIGLSSKHFTDHCTT